MYLNDLELRAIELLKEELKSIITQSSVESNRQTILDWMVITNVESHR
jgi:hypothetical protein